MRAVYIIGKEREGLREWYGRWKRVCVGLYKFVLIFWNGALCFGSCLSFGGLLRDCFRIAEMWCCANSTFGNGNQEEGEE
jgi:hypothetical protein